MAARKPPKPTPSAKSHREPGNLPTGTAGAFPGALGQVAYTVMGKPVGVNRPGGRKGGRVPFRTKTPEQREFAARLAFHGSHARRLLGLEATRDPVEVWLRIFFDSERPDTDGPVKPILDSLAVSNLKQHRPGAGILANDRQIRRYHVDRQVDPVSPRVQITVRPYSNPSPVDWDQVP
jgi:Holliday junction resolvase RusA-like endonuclease